MTRTLKYIVAMTVSLAIPCAIAQTPAPPKSTGVGAETNADLQVTKMKDPKKMTEEEKKADIAKKRAATPPPKSTGVGAETNADLQVSKMNDPKKMTEAEKKADIEAKRKTPTQAERDKANRP